MHNVAPSLPRSALTHRLPASAASPRLHARAAAQPPGSNPGPHEVNRRRTRVGDVQVDIFSPAPRAPTAPVTAPAQGCALPPSSGEGQREAVWTSIAAEPYEELPACHFAGEGSWFDTSKHALPDAFWWALKEQPNPLSYALQGKAMLGPVGFALCGLLGMVLAPLAWSVRAGLDTLRLIQPRAVTAKARWVPRRANDFAGLFASGGPALVTLSEGRLGPAVRWQTFVDGKDPIALWSHWPWHNAAAGRLAAVSASGAPAQGKAPAAFWLSRSFWDGDDKDWRKEAMEHLHAGDTVYSVLARDPVSGHERPVGDLVLESDFVASEWADKHIA